jgi:hypothetical protein
MNCGANTLATSGAIPRLECTLLFGRKPVAQSAARHFNHLKSLGSQTALKG